MKRKRKRGDHYVAIYDWERKTEAWRTMSTDARALLIELRGHYTGGENRVFLSIRDAQKALTAGQRRVQAAFTELTERGWIRQIERGAFHRKTKMATVYALANEPLSNADGHAAPKDYMRWSQKKNTIANAATLSSCPSYTELPETPEKHSDGSRRGCLRRPNPSRSVAATAAQVGYQEGVVRAERLQ